MAETIVGSRAVKIDGPEKVTGQARFVDDMGVDAMLHGATVRSPHPHCRIRGIDTRAAEALPGVVRVLTARDVPGTNRIPLVFQDHPILAEDVARFHGEAIALVAAETPEIARRAAELVKLDLEPLKAVFDMDEALRSKEVLVYGADNCYRSYVVERGDLSRGFAEAELVVEKEYEVGYQCHAYLECQGMIAFPESQGGMSVTGSLQCPYYVHDAVAMGLGIPKNRVRIVQAPTGGGFGGKEDVPSVVAAHAALMAWVTQRPVKLIYGREEDFVTMSKRHPGRAWVRYGAKKDGTLTACQVRYRINGGAYSTLSPVVLFRGIVHATGPYRIDNVRVDGFAVATNTVPCGAYRGFGQPQVCFGQESLIDELAEELGMDPVSLRLKNALRPGDRTATNQLVTESCGLTEAIERVREESGWDRVRKLGPLTGRKRRGIGFAASHYGVCLGAAGNYLDRAASHVQIQNDGSVIVAIGNTEVGQGARTVIAQIAAEALGCRYDRVHLVDTDTTRVPDSGPTVASRTTVMSGNAVLDACKPLRAALVGKAASMLGAAPSKVTGGDGVFRHGDKTVSFDDVVVAAYKARLKMSEQGWYVAPTITVDGKTQGDAYACYTWSANAVEVEVDVETGEVKLLWCTSAHDIGRAINPQQAEGQIEGGNLQGLGYALFEDMPIHEGKLGNTSFAGYILPTASDAPKYRAIILEKPYEEGPFGAKGLGEPPLIGMAPAVANAIQNAVGVRLRRLPLRPEDVWGGLPARQGGRA